MWKSILVNKSWNFHQFLLIPILIKFLGMGLFFYTTKACSAASLFVANMTIADLCVSVLISSGPVLMKKKINSQVPHAGLRVVPNWHTPELRHTSLDALSYFLWTTESPSWFRFRNLYFSYRAVKICNGYSFYDYGNSYGRRSLSGKRNTKTKWKKDEFSQI